MILSTDQAWFAFHEVRRKHHPPRCRRRGRGAGAAVGTAVAAAPYRGAVRGMRARLIQPGTSEADTKTPHRLKPLRGFLWLARAYGPSRSDCDEALFAERRRPQGAQGGA